MKLFHKAPKESITIQSQTQPVNVPVTISDLNINKCPMCGDKLIKGKVRNLETSFMQGMKCKNPECPFQKNITFTKG